QLQDDVLHVLADVAGFGERGGVDDGERHVEHFGQRLREQRFARARRADEHDVALGELHVAVALAIHVDALVVVVDRYGELLFGLLLADDVLVEEDLDLLRLGQVVGRGGGMGLSAVVFENGVADGHALVADVGSRVVAGRGDQLRHCVLGLVAERTFKDFVGAGPGSHVTAPSTTKTSGLVPGNHLSTGRSFYRRGQSPISRHGVFTGPKPGASTGDVASYVSTTSLVFKNDVVDDA